MILECEQCGRPLGATEMVSESRRCVGCSGPVSPAALSGRSNPAWRVACAAWHDGINAQKRRLGLDTAQRAALTGALLARRGLSACTPAELYEQIAVVATLQSVTEVEAFIRRQRWEGGA